MYMYIYIYIYIYTHTRINNKHNNCSITHYYMQFAGAQGNPGADTTRETSGGLVTQVIPRA